MDDSAGFGPRGPQKAEEVNDEKKNAVVQQSNAGQGVKKPIGKDFENAIGNHSEQQIPVKPNEPKPEANVLETSENLNLGE